MNARATLFSAALGFSLVACATALNDEVVSAVERRAEHNGRTVTLSGELRERKGFYNLHSRDGQECIGLLLTDQQRVEYRSSVGRRVTLTGTLEAEGCGGNNMCVEHLCAPTILTGVSAATL